MTSPQKVLAAAAALLAVVVFTPAAVASPYGTYPACVNPLDAYETQATDADSAIGGEHIHTGVCLPIFAPLTGPVDVDVRTLLHNNDGRLTFVRWSWQGSIIQSIPQSVAPGPVNEYTQVNTMRLDPAKASAGYDELRFTSNVVDPTKGRWYTTTRWPMQIRGASGGYAGGPTVAGRCGAAGWYGQYLNVYVDCRDLARIRAGALSGVVPIRVKMEHEHGIVAVDPHLHEGNPGVVLYDGAGSNQWRTINLDTRGLANGYHKLRVFTEHTRSSKPVGTFGGAFVVPFLVGN